MYVSSINTKGVDALLRTTTSDWVHRQHWILLVLLLMRSLLPSGSLATSDIDIHLAQRGLLSTTSSTTLIYLPPAARRLPSRSHEHMSRRQHTDHTKATGQSYGI